MFAEQASQALFVEPANAKTILQLGSLALRCGQTHLARQLWKRSLQVSIEFQTEILLDAQPWLGQERGHATVRPRMTTSEPSELRRTAGEQNAAPRTVRPSRGAVATAAIAQIRRDGLAESNASERNGTLR